VDDLSESELPDYLQPVPDFQNQNLTYSDKEILVHKVDLQVFYLERELDIIQLKMRLDSTEYEWKFRDEMDRLLYQAKAKLKKLEEVETDKKRWQDRIRLRLYYWSIKGRLEKEEI